MQNFSSIEQARKLSDSRVPLLDNDQTVMSESSGTTFPTLNLVEGMPCFRTDEKKLYRYRKDGTGTLVWQLELDLNKTLAYKGDIDTLTTAVGQKLPLAGGSMTGFLLLHADPTNAKHAATKGYVDGLKTSTDNTVALKFDKAGGTLTGPLTLYDNPTQNMHAATKMYVDGVANNSTSAISGKLSRAGDTLSEVYNNGWYRSNGAVGWYNQTYGGGIYMNEASFVRTYGAKGFATDWHTLQPGGGIWTSAYGWLENRFATKGQFHHTYTVGNCGDGSAIQVSVSGNSINLALSNNNCNCNCNCANN
ncbi:hypothetical protein [Cupriavidus sp. RAF12]|uniref:hypothetical protein n=1 Tax=Cupriavidus sp. RAF12 TaxID=3233050 RepID=UPI003F9378B8